MFACDSISVQHVQCSLIKGKWGWETQIEKESIEHTHTKDTHTHTERTREQWEIHMLQYLQDKNDVKVWYISVVHYYSFHVNSEIKWTKLLGNI